MPNTIDVRETVTDLEFVRWRQGRRALILMLDTSEMLILGMCVLWGAQLVLYKQAYGMEPVSAALREFAPRMPLWFHGYGLMLVGAIHLFGIVTSKYAVRRRCILAQVGFLVFAWASFLLGHLFIPAVLVLPWFWLLSWWNYAALRR